MQRLSTFIAGLFLLCAAHAPAAQATDWPTRPVKVITPQPAGTGIDLAARLFAERLSIKWGQGVVVENRPGADGVLGVAAFVNALKLFGIGSSWGGYESLVTAPHPEKVRTATKWNPGGPTIRLHIGLEDPADLIADLQQALPHLR